MKYNIFESERWGSKMDNYQEFINQYPDRYKGSARKVVAFMADREDVSLMGDDLYDLFGRTIIGKSKFYTLRSILIDFIEYKNNSNKDMIINRISKVSQAKWAKHMDENISAYTSLDELIELLGQIADEEKLNRTDATPLQSMAILVWMGYTNSDIIEFKISDIDAMKSIDERHKEILKTYASLRYYKPLPSGRIQKLVDSDYLFRTAHTDKLNNDDVTHIISKINSIVSKKGKKFTRVFLNRSKIFTDIYAIHRLDISDEIIRDYFGASKEKAEINILIDEYQKWVKKLLSNQKEIIE